MLRPGFAVPAQSQDANAAGAKKLTIRWMCAFECKSRYSSWGHWTTTLQVIRHASPGPQMQCHHCGTTESVRDVPSCWAHVGRPRWCQGCWFWGLPQPQLAAGGAAGARSAGLSWREGPWSCQAASEAAGAPGTALAPPSSDPGGRRGDLELSLHRQSTSLKCLCSARLPFEQQAGLGGCTGFNAGAAGWSLAMLTWCAVAGHA